MEKTGASPHSLRHRAVRGGAFTLCAQWGRFAIRFATMVILARLLEPEQFGVVAIVLIVTGFLSLMGDVGLTQVAIRSVDLDDRAASGLFWIVLCAGLVLSGATLLASPVLAGLIDDPRIGPTLAVGSTGIVIAAAGSQHVARLQRQLRFGWLATAEVIAQLLGAIAAIGIALGNGGHWALLSQHLVVLSTVTIISWLATGWVPSAPTSIPNAYSRVRQGFGFAGSELLNYSRISADALILGRRSGSSDVGEYTRAQGLLQMPLSQIVAPIIRVATPLLASVQADRPRFQAASLTMLAPVALVVNPLVAILIFTGPDLVTIVLGPRFTEARTLFSILAIASWGLPLTLVGTSVALALGRARSLLLANAFQTSWFLLAFWIGSNWGASGIAWALVIATQTARIPVVAMQIAGTPVTLRPLLNANAASAGVSLIAATAMCIPAFVVPISNPALSFASIATTGTIATLAATLGLKRTRQDAKLLFALMTPQSREPRR